MKISNRKIKATHYFFEGIQLMTIEEIEKLITFYNNCTHLSEETKQQLIDNLWSMHSA